MARKYFGTDGIRGRVGEGPISADFVLRLGNAYGHALREAGMRPDARAGGQWRKPQVVIGKDASGNPVYLNEDSVAFEFDEANLFRPDKFPGYDLYEDGVRLNVGGRAEVLWDDGRRANLLVGRSFRDRVNTVFPATSGLQQRQSDWIVAADATPIRGLTVFARARLDSDSLDAHRVAAAKAVLDKLGAMSMAASNSGATALITHAQSLRDLPRLLLIAEAARDRAAAAAKRLPRDGRLLDAARGQLTVNRDLAIAIAIAALAFLGALFVVSMMGWRATRRALSRMGRDDDYSDSELIDIGGVRGF